MVVIVVARKKFKGFYRPIGKFFLGLIGTVMPEASYTITNYKLKI